MQLARLIAAARRRRAPARPLFTDAAALDLVFDPVGRALLLDGAPLRVDAAFIRQDVFRPMRTQSARDAASAQGWKRALDAWIWSNPAVRAFNRGFMLRDAVNKPYALALAAEAGLATPRTRLHADAARALAEVEHGFAVMKPAAGGDLCRLVTDATLGEAVDGALSQPMLFQERLVAPEIRIFRVGQRFLGFELRSDALDYRDPAAKSPTILPVEPPPALVAPLGALLDRLGLDFAACDFKTRPSDGALCFLEANSNPMFAAFDQAAAGALTGAMLDHLLGHGAQG